MFFSAACTVSWPPLSSRHLKLLPPSSLSSDSRRDTMGTPGCTLVEKRLYSNSEWDMCSERVGGRWKLKAFARSLLRLRSVLAPYLSIDSWLPLSKMESSRSPDNGLLSSTRHHTTSWRRCPQCWGSTWLGPVAAWTVTGQLHTENAKSFPHALARVDSLQQHGKLQGLQRLAADSERIRPKHLLPSVWSWNASSLFHHEDSVQRARARFLCAAAECHDVTTAQECHCTEPQAKALPLASHMILASPSSSPSSLGGVIICVASSYMRKFKAAHTVDLVPGRALAVEFDTHVCERSLVFIAIHLQAMEGWTWAQIVTRVADYIDALPSDAFVMLAGDYNLDLDVCDRVCMTTARMCGKIGNRAHLWRRRFSSDYWTDLVAGYTYISKASQCASSLDRFHIRAPIAVVLEMGAEVRLIGAGTPPCQGDHFPVALQWTTKKLTRSNGIARWMEHHPNWQMYRDSWASLLDDPTKDWTSRWDLMMQAMRCAASELRSDRAIIPAGSAHVDRHFALRTLRLLISGQGEAALCIVRRAPHWKLARQTSYAALEKGVCRVIREASVAILTLRAEEPNAADRHACTKGFVMRLLRMWKLQQIRRPVYEVCEPGQSPGSRNEQLQCVISYWRSVFQRADDVTEADFPALLSHCKMLPWPEVDLSKARIHECIKHCPPTAPGPDGVTYKMLAGSDVISDILAAGAAGMAAGDAVPSELTCSYFVLLAKKDDHVLQPGDLRPLTLMNCAVKIVLRCLAADLTAALVRWHHPPQFACVPGRHIVDAQVYLESSCAQLGALSEQATATFLDMHAAFPSLSRKWTRAVLRHLRVPDLIWHLLNIFMLPTASLVQWDGELHPAYDILSGQLQGSPVAAWVFIVSLSPWIEFLASRTHPPAVLQAYMDDVRFTSGTCRELVLQLHGLVVLRRCAGLTVNMLKTVVLLLGSQSEVEWRESIRSAMHGQGTLADQLNVRQFTKQLGHVLGHSDDYDAEAAGKLQARAEVVMGMRVGLPRQLQLLRIVATTVTHHQLMAYEPSEVMRDAWNMIASSLGAGPRGWARELLRYCRPLFGLPQNLELLEALSFQLRIQALARTEVWPPALENAVAESRRDLPVGTSHRQSSWLNRGILKSWREALDVCTRAGLASLDENVQKVVIRHTASQLYQGLLQLHLPRIDQVKELLSTKVWQWLWWTFGQNDPQWRRKCNTFLNNVARCARLSGPAATMALLRISFHGVRLKRGCTHSHCFSCCLCRRPRCLGGARRALSTGCFKDGLIAHKRYAWLVSLPGNFVVQEMSKSTCPDLMIKCIGNVAGIICNAVWHCNEQPWDANPMLDAAKRWHQIH
eukprot:5923407-Amphidinium_carterae.1